MVQWIQANPALFSTLIWPLLTAILSCVYQYAMGIPRLHAFFSMLVGAGFDLPKVLEAIRRTLTGTYPAPVGPVLTAPRSIPPPAVTIDKRGQL